MAAAVLGERGGGLVVVDVGAGVEREAGQPGVEPRRVEPSGAGVGHGAVEGVGPDLGAQVLPRHEAHVLAEVVGVLVGNEAITVVRTMLGATNGTAATPGTVRGDFSISKQNNLIHGSDSPESATREIALWFKPEEVLDYALAGHEWVFGGA